MNGLEFVTPVCKSIGFRSMATVMITTGSDESLIVGALGAAAHEYLMRPSGDQSLIDKMHFVGVTSRCGGMEEGDGYPWPS